MPHYKDGTKAEVGDYVVGKGYNVKDSSGELTTIAGTLIHVVEGSDACNVQVAYTAVFGSPSSGPVDLLPGQKMLPGGKFSTPRVEYGQADHFEKVA